MNQDYEFIEEVEELNEEQFRQLVKGYIDEKNETELKRLFGSFHNTDFAFALRYCADTNNTVFFEMVVDHFKLPIELRFLPLHDAPKTTLMQYLLATENLACLNILLQSQKNLSVKTKAVQARVPSLIPQAIGGRIDLDYLLLEEMQFALDLFMVDKLSCLKQLLENPKQHAVFTLALDDAVLHGKVSLLLKLVDLEIPLSFTVPKSLVLAALNIEKESTGITEVLLANSGVDFTGLRFNGNTIVHRCITEKLYSLLAYLLYRIRRDNLKLLEVTNHDGLTPLALACSRHDMVALQFFQMRSFFETPEVFDYVNSEIDNKSLMWHIITSGIAHDVYCQLLINYVDINYRDPEGKSYLELLCRKVSLYERTITFLVNKHPQLIDTLSPYAFNCCLKLRESTLRRDLVFLCTTLPKIEVSAEVQQLDAMKKSVLQCCKPWNFTKLLNLKRQHENNADFQKLLEILSEEHTCPNVPRTLRQRQAFKVLVDTENQDEALTARKNTIIDELLAYQTTSNLHNRSRVDSLLVAIVCAKDMAEVNECIDQQIKIHCNIKVVFHGPASECPDHLQPMGHWLLKRVYWGILKRLEQPEESAHLIALK